MLAVRAAECEPSRPTCLRQAQQRSHPGISACPCAGASTQTERFSRPKRSRVVLAAPSMSVSSRFHCAVGGSTRLAVVRFRVTFSHYTGRCAPRLLLRLTNLQMCSGVIRVGCGKASMDYLRELVARPAGSMDDCHQVTTSNSNRPQPIARLSPLCNLSSFRQRLQPRACSTTGGHAGSQADCHRQQRSCCRAGSRHAKYCHVHGKRRPTGNAWQGEPRRREPRVGRAGG